MAAAGWLWGFPRHWPVVGKNRRGGTTVSQCLCGRSSTPGCLSTNVSLVIIRHTWMQSVFGVSRFLSWMNQMMVYTWVRQCVGLDTEPAGSHVLVNMLNMSILVSYQCIPVRSFYSEAQIAAIFSKSWKKGCKCGQLYTYSCWKMQQSFSL